MYIYDQFKQVFGTKYSLGREQANDRTPNAPSRDSVKVGHQNSLWPIGRLDSYKKREDVHYEYEAPWSPKSPRGLKDFIFQAAS